MEEGMTITFTKTSKFKATAKDAISRLEFLKIRHLARCSVSLSDVVQLLQLGHLDKALDRVEMVIKEQDLLQAFDMIEGYCVLLREIVDLVKQESTLPKSVKEAISSLIYAATRCGEFPELQDFRSIFTSWCGKEFVKSAAGLRFDCGVNPKIIQKLSTRMTSLDNRVKVLKKIAADNKIVFKKITDDNKTVLKKIADDNNVVLKKIADDNKIIIHLQDTGSKISQEKSFESATNVAVAATSTVELTQPDSHDPDDSNRFRKPTRGSLTKSKLEKAGEKKDVKGIKDLEVKKVSYRIQELQGYSSESSAEEEEEEDEILDDDMVQKLKAAALYRKNLAATRAESAHKIISETKTTPHEDLYKKWETT